MKKLGFYPTQMNSHAGAANFLRNSNAILDQKNSVIWLTPEGRFCDIRDQSADLMPGLPHLVANRDKLAVVSLAIEYVFWNEQKPYMLMRLSEPIFTQELPTRNKVEVNAILTKNLRDNQAALAKLAIARSISPFQLIKNSSKRPSHMYDFARLMKSIFQRKRVQLRHESD